MESIRFRIPRERWRHGLPVYVGRVGMTGPPAGIYLRVGTRAFGVYSLSRLSPAK